MEIVIIVLSGLLGLTICLIVHIFELTFTARRAHDTRADALRAEIQSLTASNDWHRRQYAHNREHDRLAAAEWVVFSEALAALNDVYDAMEAPDVS